MSVTVERNIKLIPSGGDNLLKVNLASTSSRLSGVVDATSVPYVTSFSLVNQDVSQIIGLENLKNLVELDIRNNRYLEFTLGDHLIDQKPIKLYNISDTRCKGIINGLSSYSTIEYFYANNTNLSGGLRIPSTAKLIEVQGLDRKSTINGELAPLDNNPNLTYFNCSNNKLKKTVTIGKLPKAIHLDFSKNEFDRLILNTLTVQTSNIRVFNFADNLLTNKEEGLEDVYNVLKFFEKLKTQYLKGKSITNNFDYVINLSGASMPALVSDPENYGYTNLLMIDLVRSLTSTPYPWKVHMGSRPVREDVLSIRRARAYVQADPDVKEFIKDWEIRNNEIIPTKDFELLDTKVKKLKTITPYISGALIETTNPALTSAKNRTILSAIPISPTNTQYKWYISTFWDLVGLDFSADPDHTEYVNKFKKSYLQSKGVSLTYYSELLFFIKTAKWLNIWDSMIVFPLRYNQYKNTWANEDDAMIRVESLGGGQVNPQFVPTPGTKGTHTLRMWFKRPGMTDDREAGEANPLPNTLVPTLLSSIDGIPFNQNSFPITDSRYNGLQITISPNIWMDAGFSFISYMGLTTPPTRYMNQMMPSCWEERFSFMVNWDMAYELTSKFRKSSWIEQQGRHNKLENAGNKSGDYSDISWPRIGGGYRMNYEAVNATWLNPSRYINVFKFEQRANGKVAIIENDPYWNPEPDPKVTRPYMDENVNMWGYDQSGQRGRYGWTPWRDLRVSYLSGSFLTFQPNQNMVWKFWNNSTSWPDQTSLTTPTTSLTFRYKNWFVPINKYNYTDGELEFTIQGPSHAFSLPEVLRARFGHIRPNETPTEIAISDASGLTYNYKRAVVDSITRNTQNTTGTLKIKIRDKNIVYPLNTVDFNFYTSQGFVPGTTGIQILENGSGYTPGIYYNVPFKHAGTLQNTSVTLTSIPLSSYTVDAPYKLFSTGTEAPGTPNLNGLTWSYYASLSYGRMTNSGSVIEEKPLFYDSTKTYAMWWLSADNTWVITTTGLANNPHFSASQISSCFIRLTSTTFLNPRVGNRRINFLGSYSASGFNLEQGNASAWTGSLHASADADKGGNSSFSTLNSYPISTLLPGFTVSYGTSAENIFTATNYAFTVAGFSSYTLRVDSSLPVNATGNRLVYDAEGNNTVSPPWQRPGPDADNVTRYERQPAISAVGTVYINSAGTIAAISATQPGRGITVDQIFTFDPVDIGGTGGSALFRVNGIGTDTQSGTQALRSTVNYDNPIGNYYLHTPHIVCNTMTIWDDYRRGTDANGYWGLNTLPDQNGPSDTANIPGFYTRCNDYSDESFITNHFIFNSLTDRTRTTINDVSSIYVCGRWWPGTGSYIFNRNDSRYALDMLKNNNTGPNLGTLTIENTATGEGMAFTVHNIIPEKRWRHVRSRVFYYSSEVPGGQEPFLLHTGVGTDYASYLGIDNNYYCRGVPPLLQAENCGPARNNDGIRTDRAPMTQVGWSPLKISNSYGETMMSFNNPSNRNRTRVFGTKGTTNCEQSNTAGLQGTLKFLMWYRTSWTELCANNFLRNNTLHNAITSFFFETSGVDLTPEIR